MADLFVSGVFNHPTFSAGNAPMRWPNPNLADKEAALAKHQEFRVETDPKKPWNHPQNEAAREWRRVNVKLKDAVAAAMAIHPLWEKQK